MASLFKSVTASNQQATVPADDASAPRPLPGIRPATKLVIRDLALDMSIGVYDHEKQAKQQVLVNIEAELAAPGPAGGANWRADDIGQSVCYAGLADGVAAIAGRGHINLLETFAEYIALYCLENARIGQVTVRVEKPGAIANAAAAGVEIVRARA